MKVLTFDKGVTSEYFFTHTDLFIALTALKYEFSTH